jgi:hypothetical protein
MFDIEATVTVATPTKLKLTADWPIRWLEALGGYEIQHKISITNQAGLRLSTATRPLRFWISRRR